MVLDKCNLRCADGISVYKWSVIIPLTLSNLSEFRALGLLLLIKLTFTVAVFLSASFTFLWCGKEQAYYCSKRFFILFFLPALVYIKGPLCSLYYTMDSYCQQLAYKPEYNYPEIAHKFIKYNIWNEDDPLLLSGLNKPNVIVIFVEGLSASVIDQVNKAGLNLTPNLNAFYVNSISFKNYYNHTAATFRGLRGQLTSAYQYKDGIGDRYDGFFEISNDAVYAAFDKRLISLPDILNRNGYKTFFVASTEKNSTLNTMLKTMSFTHVYGMGDFK